MANRGLGSLTLQLILGMGGFTAPLDKAGRDLDKKTRAMEKRAYEFGKQIGTALKIGVGLGVTALGAFGVAMKSAIDQADQLNEISQKIGVPTDVLSGLNYAAKLAGVATEELQAGLVKMIKTQADAAAGGKDAVLVFKTLGIAIKDSSGNLRGTSEVFGDFAQVFATLKDGPEKTALALKVFGKAGAELIPLLNEGRAGISGYTAELEKLGGIVTPEAALEADAFNDNLDKLKVAFGGLALQVASDLLPDLIELTDNFVALTKEGDGVSGAAADISEAIRILGKALELVTIPLQFIIDLVQATTSGFIGYGLAVKGAAQALTGDFAGAAKSYKDSLDEMKQADIAFNETRAKFADKQPDNPDSNPIQFATNGPTSRGRGKPVFDLSPLFTPEVKAKSGKSDAERAAEKAAAEAAKAHADALDDLREKLESVGKASEEFSIQLQDLRDAGDPLAQALTDYNRQLAALKKLEEDGEVSTKDRAEAERLLDEQYAKTTEDIKERLDTGGQHIKQMQQELDLLKMQTQAERDRAAFLLDNPTATSEQADAAARIQSQIDETRKAIAAQDELRQSFEDNFAAVLDGSKSAKDAFKDFADSIVQQLIRIAAQKAALSLFGEQGSSGGGILGGLVSSLFGAYTGGSSGGAGAISSVLGSGSVSSFATGTNFAPGGLAWVGEQGPELMNLPRGSQIIPHHESLRMASGSRGVSVVQNFNRPVDRRTGTQAAQSTARAVGRATERMS